MTDNFSGTMSSAGADDGSEMVERPEDVAAAVTAEAQAGTRLMVFMDGDLPDLDRLRAQFGPEVETVVLRGVDPFAAIGATLRGRGDRLDAVHVIAHGREGFMHLGDDWFYTSQGLFQRDLCAAIGGAIRPDGDIFLYAVLQDRDVIRVDTVQHLMPV